MSGCFGVQSSVAPGGEESFKQIVSRVRCVCRDLMCKPRKSSYVMDRQESSPTLEAEISSCQTVVTSEVLLKLFACVFYQFAFSAVPEIRSSFIDPPERKSRCD